MKKKIKKIFKERSKLLFITITLETILLIWILLYFNYMDHIMYQTSSSTTNGLALLIQNMYTSTWWALIILAYSLISIFSITSFIFKDLKYHFMSLCLWIILLILAINFQDTIKNNLGTLFIFIPIFILNIFAYKNQKKINQK